MKRENNPAQEAIIANQLADERDYWLNQLSGDPVYSGFYKESQNSANNKYRLNKEEFVFSNDIYQKLMKLSTGNNAKLYIILAAFVILLLEKYGGTNDIIVGAPILKQKVQGEFINTVLVLRNRLYHKMTVKDLLQQVKACILEANKNQNYPIASIFERLNLSYSGQDNPLFDTFVLLQNVHDKNYILHLDPGMIFSFIKTETSIAGELEYNAHHYQKSSIKVIIASFSHLLARGLDNVNLPLEQIDVMSEEEKKTILYDFNNTSSSYPYEKTIQSLFADQAEKWPAKIALRYYGDLSEVYEELVSKQKHIGLSHEFEKCCFKKNQFILHLKDKTLLNTLGIFTRQEAEELKLLWTSKHKIWKDMYNYAAVNPATFLLLEYFNGNRTLKSIFANLKKQEHRFIIYPMETADPEFGKLKVEKEEYRVHHRFIDFILLIKRLYNLKLIDLVGYRDHHALQEDEVIQLPGKVEKFLAVNRRECRGEGESGDISSPGEYKKDAGSPVLLLGDTTGTATTGLVYLASYLRRHGIEAYCQWNDLSITASALKKNIRDLLDKINPAVVGISMKWFPHIARVLEISRQVKAYDSSTRVVVGGNSASYYWEKIIQYDTIDYIVRGDGELPLLKICSGHENIPNCVYRKNNQIITTPMSYVQNRESCNDIFLSHLDKVFVNRWDPYLAYPLFINIGKGCGYQCFFCGGCREAQKQIFNRPAPFRRPAEMVKRDIQAVKQFTTTLFFDSDICFSTAVEFFAEVFQGIDLSNHFCAFFFNQIPGANFIDLLAKTFKYLYLHIDMVSLSQRHRLELNEKKVVKKQPTDEELIRFFKCCDTYKNLEVAVNLITGVPFYTREDITASRKTFSFLFDNFSSFIDLSWGRLHAQPAAPINEDCKNYGMHSYAVTFEDFLEYSQRNLNEEIYPGLDDINYPYIYFNDDKLNSEIGKFWVEADGKIKRKFAEQQKHLVVTREISYIQLDQRGNELACVLRGVGVGASCIAAIMLDQSIGMITAILAVLKAGGAYLPIDPGYPQQRIDLMLEDSGATVLLTKKHLIKKVKPGKQLLILDVDEKRPYPGKTSIPGIIGRSTDPAYAVYTSGTSGKPKAVLIEHRHILNYIYWRIGTYGQSPHDTSLQLVSTSFDGFCANLYPTLLSGGKVILVKDFWENIHLVRTAIKEEKVTNFSTVPSLLKILLEVVNPEDLPSLTFIVLAGEKAGEDLVKRAQDLMPHVKLINEYGPTENSVTTAANTRMTARNLSIVGPPIANNQVFILDQVHGLKPVGVPGELCVTGAGLARGYLNHPELTAEKFIEGTRGLAPLLENRSSRSYKSYIIYKTGDRARWLPGGSIELLGRIDQQVKIRGFRIELEEIENYLLKHRQVKEALVTPKEDENSIPDLHAYIVPFPAGDEESRDTEGELAVPRLREYLEEHFPRYMIPSQIRLIDKIPLTANGKVDRNALDRIEAAMDAVVPYAAPVNDIQKRLVEIWKEELKLEQIGIKDNFFNIGGNSIKAIRLLNLIREEFHVTFKIADLYENDTIESLAEKVEIQETVDIKDEDGYDDAIKEIEALKDEVLKI